MSQTLLPPNTPLSPIVLGPIRLPLTPIAPTPPPTPTPTPTPTTPTPPPTPTPTPTPTPPTPTPPTPMGPIAPTPPVPVPIAPVPTPPSQPPISIINNNNNVNNTTVVQQVLQQQQNIQPVVQSVSQTPPGTLTIGPPVQVGTPTAPPPPAKAGDNFQVLDEAAQAAFHTPGAPYPGPIAGITNEYVNINTTNLDITAITPNAFIQTGSGNDTLSAFYGRNVLDGGGGSNVFIGGIGGSDTFIANVEGSGSLADLVKNFHINDDIVIRGLTSSISTSDSSGPAGPQLEILGTNTSGSATAVTIAGYSSADIGGRLSISFTTGADGIPEMLIHANG